jgi:hypothetical protein
MTALDSLRDARITASSLYDKADKLDPKNPDLQQLWNKEVETTNLYWSAAAKTLQGDDAAISAAQNGLDNTVGDINKKLLALQDVNTALNLASGLVTFATTLAKFFV